jgi:hypothetical protein
MEAGGMAKTAREMVQEIGRRLREQEDKIKQGVCPVCGGKIGCTREEGQYRHVYCTEEGCDFDDNEL